MLNTKSGHLTYRAQSWAYDTIRQQAICPVDQPTIQQAWQLIYQWSNGQTSWVFNTSGSTGKPKPITLSRARLEASATKTIRKLGLKAGQTALTCLPIARIAGAMMVIRALEADLDNHLVEPTGRPLAEQVSRIDFAAMVPLQVDNSLRHEPDRARLNRLQSLIIGGAPIAHTLEQHIRCALPHPAVFATFGMTETVSHIALRRISADSSANQCFETLEGVRIGQDEDECLQINADVTDHQWISTRDRVRLLDDHRFEWLGRADFTINSGGIKVQPEQLEKKMASLLQDLGLDLPFLVSAIPDAKFHERVVLVIESRESCIDKPLILSHLNARLSLAEKPADLLVMAQLPTTAGGKLDRPAVRKWLSGQIG